jgi:hypothetical protein
LDNWDVPSLCQISYVWVSGRQFFPREGIRHTEQTFNIGITISVRRMKNREKIKLIVHFRVTFYGIIYIYIVRIPSECWRFLLTRYNKLFKILRFFSGRFMDMNVQDSTFLCPHNDCVVLFVSFLCAELI